MPAAGIAITVETEVGAPTERAFAVVVPIDLALIFRGLGPLPRVAGTREQTGAWDHVGATRVVELGDGSEAREELTAYAAPGHFAYRLGGFTGPLRHLVSHADGAWWFSASGAGGCRIRWTYTFAPRPFRAVLVRALIAPLWRVYQGRALALAVSTLGSMPDLEEQTLDKPGDRCEVCGATLTDDEQQAVLESGGPALCKIHADEIVPVEEEEEDFSGE